MSIHHRSQAAINARRQAIKQRIKQGHFESWLLKLRNRRRRARGLPPLPADDDAESDAAAAACTPSHDSLSKEALALLICFWTCVWVITSQF